MSLRIWHHLLHRLLRIKSLNSSLWLLLLWHHVVLPLYLISERLLLRALQWLDLNKTFLLILVKFRSLSLGNSYLLNLLMLLLLCTQMHILNWIRLYKLRLLRHTVWHIWFEVNFLMVLEALRVRKLFPNRTLNKILFLLHYLKTSLIWFLFCISLTNLELFFAHNLADLSLRNYIWRIKLPWLVIGNLVSSIIKLTIAYWPWMWAFRYVWGILPVLVRWGLKCVIGLYRTSLSLCSKILSLKIITAHSPSAHCLKIILKLHFWISKLSFLIGWKLTQLWAITCHRLVFLNTSKKFVSVVLPHETSTWHKIWLETYWADRSFVLAIITHI